MPSPTPDEFARKIKDILKHVQPLVDEASGHARPNAGRPLVSQKLSG
jgi:hypothetical protein